MILFLSDKILVRAGYFYIWLVLLLFPSCLLAEEHNSIQAPLLPWKELTLEGSKALTRFMVRVKFEDASGVCPFPFNTISAEHFRCPYPHGGITLLSAETVTMSLILPQEKYEHYLWFDPNRLEARQRARWKKSGKKWLKLYKWDKEGVFRLSIRPKDEMEETLDPSRWSKRYTSFYKYPMNISGTSKKLIVSEPLALIYIASKLGLGKKKEKTSLLVFGKKTLHNVTIRFLKEKEKKVCYQEQQGLGLHEVKGRAKLYVYGIEAEPVDASKYQEEFSLLGLNKNIEISVQVANGVIVRIRGDNDVIGHVDLKLIRAILNSPASSRN